MKTLDDLIYELEELRSVHGGDTGVAHFDDIYGLSALDVKYWSGGEDNDKYPPRVVFLSAGSSVLE